MYSQYFTDSISCLLLDLPYTLRLQYISKYKRTTPIFYESDFEYEIPELSRKVSTKPVPNFFQFITISSVSGSTLTLPKPFPNVNPVIFSAFLCSKSLANCVQICVRKETLLIHSIINTLSSHISIMCIHYHTFLSQSMIHTTKLLTHSR